MKLKGDGCSIHYNNCFGGLICKKFDDGCDNGVGRCVDESQDAGRTFSLQNDFYWG